jgi:hypothetical protein
MWSRLSDLLKTYQLEPLSLMRDIKLEVKNYLPKEIELQTLLVFQSYPPISKRKRENEKYFKFIPEKYVSILEEKVRGKLMDQNNALCKQWDAALKAQGIQPGDKKYGPKLDEEVARTTKKFRQELYESVLREEAYFRCLELDPHLESKAEEEIDEVVEKYVSDHKNRKAIHRYITRGRIGYKRERIYHNQVPPEFIPLIDLNGEVYNWVQVYLVINHLDKTIKYTVGRSRGSYGRDVHSYYAQIFGALKNQGKEFCSHVLLFNHQGNFSHFCEPNLIIIDRDLRNAFTKGDEFNEHLKTARLVQSAKDLAFDFFTATGQVLLWEEK